MEQVGGKHLDANIDQDGCKNSVDLVQTSGDVDIDQNGVGNKVLGLHSCHGYGEARFGGSELDVRQSGIGNQLELMSDSRGATVEVTQCGGFNKAVVVQH